MPQSPERPHQVGHIPELVHIIGGFLKSDDDFQSLSRMAVGCKMYRDDLREWMEEKKEGYRKPSAVMLGTMTPKQLELVQETADVAELRLSKSALLDFCVPELGSRRGFLSPTTMRGVKLVRYDEPNDPSATEDGDSPLPADLQNLHITSTEPGLPESSLLFQNWRETAKRLCRIEMTLIIDNVGELDDELAQESLLQADSGWMCSAAMAGFPDLAHTTTYTTPSWTICGAIRFQMVSGSGSVPTEGVQGKDHTWSISIGSNNEQPGREHIFLFTTILTTLLREVGGIADCNISIHLTAHKSSLAETNLTIGHINNDLAPLALQYKSRAMQTSVSPRETAPSKLSISVVLESQPDREAVEVYKAEIDFTEGWGAEWKVARHDEKVTEHYAAVGAAS